jgi:hypothetical protein
MGVLKIKELINDDINTTADCATPQVVREAAHVMVGDCDRNAGRLEAHFFRADNECGHFLLLSRSRM